MSELDNMTTNPADIATEETSKQSSDATSVADALKDIIDLAEQTKAAGSTSVFNRYRNQAEIAREIANVLFSKKYNSGGAGKRSRSLPQGFFATDFDKSQVGLLTECYGLQIIYSLSRMGLDVSPYNKQIDYVLNDIFEHIRLTDETVAGIEAMADHIDSSAGLLEYDMTPFINGDDDDGASSLLNSCVEAASNVLKGLNEIRWVIGHQSDDLNAPLSFTFNGTEVSDEDMIGILESAIRYTLNWICDACIPLRNELTYKVDNKKAKNPSVRYKGWNFFKYDAAHSSSAGEAEEYEQSLYMTFSVCSAYMSLFNILDEKIRADVDNNKVNENSSSAEYKRSCEYYKRIRAEFKRLQSQCISAGRYEEMCGSGLFNRGQAVDITTSFIGQNYTSVTYQDIENSTTNDAVINTVFHILILIYSGVDIDYDMFGKANDFYDEMQYALQNILRCYKSLVKKDKTYIVDQYVLSFKEKMPAELTAMSKTLRRQRIQVASTLPLLIRAYNAVSQFLIKYPQKQNVEYLTMILQNRADADNDSKEWAWDHDGYNITSEDSYVKALKDFYSYYETYEASFIDSKANIDKALSELRHDREDLDAKLSDKTAELKEVLEDLESKKKILAETDKKIEELSNDPLLAAFEANVKRTVAAEFNKCLLDCIGSLLGKNAPSADNANPLYKSLKCLVYKMFFSSTGLFREYDITDDKVVMAIESHIKQRLSTDLTKEALGEVISFTKK